jgi:hypothetical protein
VSDVSVEAVLVALKIAFLVLLYLFIWRIVRSASRDLRLPQEGTIVAPGVIPVQQPVTTGRLVVLKSPTLPQGEEHVLDSAPLTIGRAAENHIELRGDDFASARHARFEPRRDGVWLVDTGSTNGTYVNGVRMQRPRKLTGGDVVRVGETDLRFEQ